MLPHKEAIEAHLVKRFGELFDLDYDLLLTTDEHVLRGWPIRRLPSALQPGSPAGLRAGEHCTGGDPGWNAAGYEIFLGNTTDVTTVEQIVSGWRPALAKPTGCG
ncbi:MAG: hypothetical protein IPI02_23295 [Sterolibacteriaceae bacterium]|nr:hypothetical protein [Sterolibacteriaceae bacterium]